MTYYPDTFLRDVLTQTKVIAAIGVSTNPVRPSYFVMRYLLGKGYRVLPVNPAYAGQDLFGETVVGSLSDLTEPVDMIDIFRRSDAVPQIVDEALAALPALRTIWMQIGVEHAQAAARAQALGQSVIENRCPKIEYQRLFGELRMAGFNTGIISSRL